MKGQRSAGGELSVRLSQYVGEDVGVTEPEVLLTLASGDHSDGMNLTADEALQVALALVEARELAQQG